MNSARMEELILSNPAVGKMSKKERFDTYRELYAPDLIGALNPKLESEIKQAMYATMFLDDPQNVTLTEKEEVAAFLQFAELNDAYYKDIVNDPSYKAYSLESHDLETIYCMQYGKKLGKFKYATESLSTSSFVPFILMLVSFFVRMCCKITLFDHIGNLFAVLYLTQQFGCAFLSAPLDVLLFFPRRLWKGIKQGAEVGFFLFVPISMLFHSAINLFLGLLTAVFIPSGLLTDRSDRLKESKEFKKYAAEIVNARYKRTIEDLKRFRQNEGAEVYRNTVNAMGYYKYQSSEIVQDAINRGKALLRRSHPFYFAEQERLEEKIKDKKRYIEKAKKRQERADKYEEWAFEHGRPEDSYLDYITYIDNTEYNEKLFEETKQQKEGEIDRVFMNLVILEERIQMAALTEMYIRKFH